MRCACASTENETHAQPHRIGLYLATRCCQNHMSTNTDFLLCISHWRSFLSLLRSWCPCARISTEHRVFCGKLHFIWVRVVRCPIWTARVTVALDYNSRCDTICGRGRLPICRIGTDTMFDVVRLCTDFEHVRCLYYHAKSLNASNIKRLYDRNQHIHNLLGSQCIQNDTPHLFDTNSNGWSIKWAFDCMQFRCAHIEGFRKHETEIE